MYHAAAALASYAKAAEYQTETAAANMSAQKMPRNISTARGGKLLRWVAPAGAIAAGLLIWAVVREKPPGFAPVQNIQVAQQRAEDEQAAIPQAIVPETNLRSDRDGELSRAENRKLRPAQRLGTRSLPAEEQPQLTDRLSKDGRSVGGAAGGMVAGRLATEEQGRADKYLRGAKPATPPKSAAKQGDTASASAGPGATVDARQSRDEETKNLPAMGRNEVVLSARGRCCQEGSFARAGHTEQGKTGAGSGSSLASSQRTSPTCE